MYWRLWAGELDKSQLLVKLAWSQEPGRKQKLKIHFYHHCKSHKASVVHPFGCFKAGSTCKESLYLLGRH